ncbi:MAG TPA: carboxypeptidase regulatory-like domain-containing protein [Vicinamibacterales bacterium]
MPFERRVRTAVGTALAALLLAFAPTLARAQTTSASVSGVVQDSQGAVLPGVTVTLTSRTQGNTLTTTTDAEGRFVFSIVRPDTYSLQVSLEGFKTLERTNLVVNANDRLSAGTLVMEVGQMTEEVTVSSRVSELQINSGERSFTLENSALQNIANNGRALFNFATLVPGAVPNANGGEIGSVSGFTVNGQRQNSNTMTIDGVANIDTGDNGGNMATTNIDAVAEFKVLTNAYQAEYGRAVGAQLQVVTKSGSRDFHGSGYWYGRRSDWDANSWFNNRNGVEKAKTKRNDSGYTIGGPVFFPGFNEDRRKLFFFFSQEHQRRVENNAERRTRVPTLLERQGDFSQSVDSSGNPFPYIRDYTTGLPCNASDTRGCFQDGGVLGRIPRDRLWEPGLAVLSMYPEPNLSGAGADLNYSSQAPNNTPRREDLLRMDFQATDNWRITGRYMNTKEDILQAYGTTWAGNGSDQLPTPVLFLHPGSNYMLSATGVLNSSTSVELSWGRAANSLNYELQLANLFRDSNPAFSQLPYFYPDAVQGNYVPWFQFRGGRLGNAGQYQTDRGPFTNKNVTHDVVANITKIVGSHAFKAGFYYQNSFKPQSIFGSFNATINFVDNSSNPFDTGYAYANAATGVFNTYTQASKFAIPEWRYHNVEWYVQDNWKKGRMTLDYGVRFYYLTPQWDESLQASNFLPDRFDFNNAAQLYRPVCIGAYPCSGSSRRGMDPRLIAAGVTPTLENTVEERFIGRLTPDSNRFNGAFQAGQGIDEQLQDGSKLRVSPRFGFVYDLSGTGEMILRGGWGIFYDRPQGNMVFDMISNAPGVLNSSVQWGRLQELGGGATTSEPFPVLGLNPTAYEFDPPRVNQWNIGIQRKLFGNFMYDIAYVGSKSDKLLRQVQINAVPRGATFQPENQDPTREPSAVPGGSALPTDLLRPYPGYGNIRMWGYDGYSNYHSLQTGINRRFDDGLMFSVFYVWSKALGINNDDFSAGLPNQSKEEIRRLDYSYLASDRPHNFVANFIYQLPFRKTGALGHLTNDWQISGVYRWTSGRPQGVGYSIPGIGAANLTGSSDGNPNARIVLTCDPGRGWSDDEYRQFNTSCFAPPQPGSDGAESARFFLRQPPINNLDLSVSKRFQGPKNLGFEIRVDAFNALNHTQFTGFNGTANFRSLTDPTITNLPYDSEGRLVNPNGFGTVSGVAPPRTLQIVTRVTF